MKQTQIKDRSITDAEILDEPSQTHPGVLARQAHQAAVEIAISPITEKPILEFPKQVAVLDDQGVYLGLTLVSAANELTSNHLPDINECDLPAGQYKWNKAKLCFERTPQASTARKVTEAHTLYAIAQGFKSLAAKGHEFPEVTKNWLSWYDTAISGELRPIFPNVAPTSNK